MSWFLYIVGKDVVVKGFVFQDGERGVGRCEGGPGIVDAPHGTMYIVTNEYITQWHRDRKRKRITEHAVADAILDYWG